MSEAGHNDAGRVLVVDDDPYNRDLLQQELESLGHVPLPAADGAEALRIALSGEVDVVLLDIMMPGMDGFAVLERMKADAALRAIPVIVVSALHDVANVVRGISLGADDYLPKPFEPIILEARVEQALRARRWRRKEEEYVRSLEAERERSDALLGVILPPTAVDELKATGRVAPRRRDGVAVLFADVRHFSRRALESTPERLVADLGVFVEAADRLAAVHGIERIKVVGDAVMLTGNLMKPHPAPVAACIDCAAALGAVLRDAPLDWTMRGGIGFGSVMAGVVGRTRFAFDVWGAVVNRAARLAAIESENVVFLDEPAARACGDGRPAEAGSMDLKGIGPTRIFEVRF